MFWYLLVFKYPAINPATIESPAPTEFLTVPFGTLLKNTSLFSVTIVYIPTQFFIQKIKLLLMIIKLIRYILKYEVKDGMEWEHLEPLVNGGRESHAHEGAAGMN